MTTILLGFEIIWLLTAFIGMAASLQNLRDSSADLRHLELRQLNGSRRLVALAAARRERMRLTSLTLFALLGLAVVALPWLQEVGLHIETARLGLRLGACLAIVHFTLESVLDRRDRRRLVAEIVREKFA